MFPPSQNNHSSRTYPICRICLSSEEPKSLIAPCKCKGTVKYVHKTCLAQWRRKLVSNGRPKELDTCTMCKFHYVVRLKSKIGSMIIRPEIRFIITCMLILIILFPSGYIMKLIMSLTSEIHLQRDVHGDEINNTTSTILWTSYHFPFCTALAANPTISKDYYSLITDLWSRLMCIDIIQHLHLGLFFLGSTSNVVTAYYIMNELLNLFHYNSGIGRADGKSKEIILWGSCGVVILFWFHYSLSAFQEFLHELPLWVLRWITISMAVFDFGLRRIYWQLNKVNLDDGEVMSIQKMDFNEI
ncbi:15544_t:CDS:2 [Funneliformis mosseae]|uniref:15544_t:CDS:1 n=1 Tax=Funneliformis mosseae TaxID=27381 RepID=A0A9N9D339_FUNMO|nr:15544_t:CDS:2 [Funneliformis mosseae]